MKQIGMRTRTYQYDEDYFIDIVIDSATSDEPVYEAYLYDKQNSIKELMFGMMVKDTTYRKFKKLVEANADEYIELYEENRELEEDARWKAISKELGKE